MKNNENFELTEMEQIEMPSNIIVNQNVWKVVKSVKDLLQINSPEEVIPLEEELAWELWVLDKFKSWFSWLNSANDENFSQALAS